MHPAPDTGVAATLKAFIRYLVLSFPETSVLSRQVGDRYHVFVIVPYGGGPEKAIQVERALLSESARSIKDFEGFLAQLDLPRLLERRERYELTACHRAEEGALMNRQEGSNANEGWAKAQTCSIVPHGSHHFPGPVLPSPPGAVSSVSTQ